MSLINLTNQQFGQLTVLHRDLTKMKRRHTYWICKCNCGNIISISSSDLIHRGTETCGHTSYQEKTINLAEYEKILKLSYRFGESSSRLYVIWQGMKQRCLNPIMENYQNYGGRGITICDRWLDYKNFKEDMYDSYINHVKLFGEKQTTIDRIDNNGNYELSNCKWSTYKEQNNNKKR